MPRHLTAIVLAAALFALGYAWYRLTAANSLLARVTAERDALKSALASSDSATSPAEGRGSAGVSTPLPPVEITRARQSPAPGFADKFEWWMRKQERARVLGRNAELISRLSLAGHDLQRFKDLLIAAYYVEADVRNAARKAGLARDSLAVQRMREQQTFAINQELKALVGPSHYQAVQDAMAQQSLQIVGRNVRETVGGYLIDAGCPITPDQITALATVASDVNRRFAPTPEEAHRLDPTTQFTKGQVALIQGAAKILDAGQLEVYRQYYRDENEAAKAHPSNVGG